MISKEKLFPGILVLLIFFLNLERYSSHETVRSLPAWFFVSFFVSSLLVWLPIFLFQRFSRRWILIVVPVLGLALILVLGNTFEYSFARSMWKPYFQSDGFFGVPMLFALHIWTTILAMILLPRAFPRKPLQS